MFSMGLLDFVSYSSLSSFTIDQVVTSIVQFGAVELTSASVCHWGFSFLYFFAFVDLNLNLCL